MKVLIVEDDHLIALPIKEELEQQNYLVDLASDGQLGWESATATHYDLILLDLIDKRAVLSTLSECHKKLPPQD